MTRADALRLLRRWHGWIGLWGAGLGLLFGTTGILLNHRSVLKIPAGATLDSTVQMALPTPAPADADALAAWLQQQLGLEHAATRVRQEPAHAVAWGVRSLQQPAHWSAAFTTPRMNLQADYWEGSTQVSVRRSHSNLWATLMNLHKGVGMGAAWVLLVDTLAGSILLLSLSGVLMWTRLERARLFGAGVALLPAFAAATLALLNS
ncbi:MAG TPA: PepSY-associated TM helix domain-containing protein [Nevskiaceae bacterium]|nr:PepSY-associated TM helix domain-containing protein [Nevskiaceae bacterium]